MPTRDIVKEKIYKTISKEGKWWVRKLSRKLDLDPSTVSICVGELEEEGKIRVTEGYKKYLEVKDE